MIRHIFIARTKPDIPDERINELVNRWQRMPSEIPTIRAFTAGRNVGSEDRRYTVALVADFEDWDGWANYMRHPFHDDIRQNITNRITLPSDRSMIQIEI